MTGRIRSLKPEWLQDQNIQALDDSARVMSVALILMADDYGNGRAAPAFLDAQVWPAERGKAATALAALQDIGYVQLYQVRGQSYYHLRNWAKHQRVNRPGKPRVPDLSEGSQESFVQSPKILAQSSKTLLPDHRSTITDHRSGSTINDQDLDLEKRAPKALVLEVFEYWRSALGKRVSSKLDGKRDRAIRGALKRGHSVADLKRAIDGCKRSDWHMGHNPNGRRYDDIELICRDARHTEAFIDMADGAMSGYSAPAPSEAFNETDLDEVDW